MRGSRRTLILSRSLLRIADHDLLLLLLLLLLLRRSSHRAHLVAIRVVVVTISIIGSKRIRDVERVIVHRVVRIESPRVLRLLLDDFVHDVVNLRFRQHLQIFVDGVTQVHRVDDVQ